MLVPYFIVMVILAFYGVHRYQLVWLYYRNRRNEAKSNEPPAHFEEVALPFVTIQLPIFNEQFVIDRLLDACCRLDYPRDRFEIQLLDDSTDETVDVASAMVERFAQGTQGLGPQPVYYIHRTNRRGYKAGALEEGLQTAKGELIAIFDADFIPPPQWLRQVVHHFAEDGVGMVQTRWTHLNRNYSFLTQVEAILLDGHFVLEHGGRSARRSLFQLQRHRRHVATRPRLIRSRGLAARHPHRRHRPQLPRPTQRLEVQISPGRGVSCRASHRDDRVQNPAGTLGQRPHPDLEENSARA